MSKGSGKTNVTQTTIDPTQQAQLPFLTETWNQAKNLYQNQPLQYYPGQTLTDWGRPEQISGYQDLNNAGLNYKNNLLNPTNAGYLNAVSGGMGVENSPAYAGLQGYSNATASPFAGIQSVLNDARAAGQTYADDIRSYAAPMQQQGMQGAIGGQQYGQQIGQYANPAYQYGQQAAANNNAGLNSLMQTAQGQYLNANPYIGAAIQAAQDPVTRNYQTAVAPQTDAMFSGGGRYGSGAMAGAVSTAQQNLAKGLGDISSTMMNANYGNERQLMNQAASNYGQLYNQGLSTGISGANTAGQLQQAAGNMALAGNTQAMTGLQNAAAIQNTAGNQYMQGLDRASSSLRDYMAGQQYGLTGLQSGYQSGNNAAIQGLSQAGNIANLQFTQPRSTIESGQGLQNIDQAYIDDARKRFEGQQQMPWTNLGNYQSAIGGALQGSKSETTPYYSNPLMNALSGIQGVAGLGRSLFGSSAGGGLLGSGGLGGLFGGAGAAAGLAAPAGAATGLGALAAPVAADAAWATPSLLSAIGIFSDRRLKEDTKVVGHVGDLPIHTFRYKGDPTERIGFMADEVDPAAVMDTPSGYKAVDYGKALSSALNSFRSN